MKTLLQQQYYNWIILWFYVSGNFPLINLKSQKRMSFAVEGSPTNVQFINSPVPNPVFRYNCLFIVWQRKFPSFFFPHFHVFFFYSFILFLFLFYTIIMSYIYIQKYIYNSFKMSYNFNYKRLMFMGSAAGWLDGTYFVLKGNRK